MTADEQQVLARLAQRLPAHAPGVPLGFGDDAAVVEVDGAPVAVAVDVIVDRVHVRTDVSSPADIGWKALAVNVSDLAAVAAEPVAAVVGLQLPLSWELADVDGLYDGLEAAAQRWGLTVVGGDVVDADQLALSVTVLGQFTDEGPVARGGGRDGQALVCVGGLGAGAAALRQLAAGVEPDPALLAHHRRPPAYPAAGRALAAHGATAMIDISDGLGGDVGHLCRASGVAARLDGAALPVAEGVADAAEPLGADLWELVTAGGEDFALVAALPAERAEQAAAAAAASEQVPAAVIGRLVAGEDRGEVTLTLPGGQTRSIGQTGWRHGRAQAPSTRPAVD